MFCGLAVETLTFPTTLKNLGKIFAFIRLLLFFVCGDRELAAFEGVGPFEVRGLRGGFNDNEVALSHELHGKVLSHGIYLEVISIIYVYCLYYSHEYEIYYFFKEIFLPGLILTQGSLQRWKDSLSWSQTSQMASHPGSQFMGLPRLELIQIILLLEVR
jgi:hypothetical protein